MGTRKEFIQQSAALALGSWLLSRCTSGTGESIPVRDADRDAAVGHRLRDMQFPAPTRDESVDVIVVGGGVAGLSAARTLTQNHCKRAVVLELSSRLGGNAACGAIGEMRYPLGAHYLPVVNLANSDLIEFLRESGVIQGFDAQGWPAYREDYLVQAPDERLFMRGQWHEGLIARKHFGAEEAQQFERFMKTMDGFRELKGSDGQWMFDLPLRQCSSDQSLDALDALSMSDWMEQEGYTNAYIKWLVDYSCRDDFGAGIQEVSAWAAIHYYAARRGVGQHVDRNDVMTWPEGNGFLVERLNEQHEIPIRHLQLVYAVNKNEQGFEVLVYDVPNDCSVRWQCRAVIGALPLYLATRYAVYGDSPIGELHYAPWLVANMHFKDPQGELFDYQSHWDNVLYDSKALGYIQSGHQRLHAHLQEGVMTYYWALQGSDEREVRKTMRDKTLEHWSQEIMQDLEVAHPHLRRYIQSVEIKLWGHAMLKPLVGTMRGSASKWRSTSPVLGYFPAHSDCGGLSLFEEAFDRGRQAALQTIRYLCA